MNHSLVSEQSVPQQYCKMPKNVWQASESMIIIAVRATMSTARNFAVTYCGIITPYPEKMAFLQHRKCLDTPCRIVSQVTVSPLHKNGWRHQNYQTRYGIFNLLKEFQIEGFYMHPLTNYLLIGNQVAIQHPRSKLWDIMAPLSLWGHNNNCYLVKTQSGGMVKTIIVMITLCIGELWK